MPQRNPHFQKKAWQNCSEDQLAEVAAELAGLLSIGDRVLLNGPMGCGKSTFARFLMKTLGVNQPPEGSPTFAIAHEYTYAEGDLIHIDFYRIKSASEIEEAGIYSYFWERRALVITEWLSLWPDFEKSVCKPSSDVNNWAVNIGFVDGSPMERDVVLELLE